MVTNGLGDLSSTHTSRREPQKTSASKFCLVPTTRRAFIALSFGAVYITKHADAADAEPLHPAQITSDDVAWFRRGGAVWARLESGAPAIVPPNVNANAYIDEQLAYPTPGASARRPERLEPILCAFFLNATFRPGRYRLDPPVSSINQDGVPTGSMLSTVDVTAEHLTLLQYSLWNGPLMDGKRPYGNRTSYEVDMAEILGHVAPNGADGQVSLSDAERHHYRTIHHAMLAVVQAYVQHAELDPGTYVVPRDGWSAPFHPLCRPVAPQKVADYQAFCASHPRLTGPSTVSLSDMASLDRIMRATSAELGAKAALFDPG